MARKIKVRLIMELREQGLSRRSISSSRHMSLSSVCEVFSLAEERGLAWRDVSELDDDGAYRLFYPDKYSQDSPFAEPDWDEVHRELGRKGVTLTLLHREDLEANGGGGRWFASDGTPDLDCYGTVGDTTLLAAWADADNAADFRLRATGIEVGEATVAIPVAAEKEGMLESALEFAKVRASETLPVPASGPAASATVQTRDDGTKALVVPRDPDAASMFYRIDVDVED